MRLNKLEIQGFKSFKEKTELVFDKQFSVIVGPNGSGKSNISDAIRWALGEQSAKSLRGSKMEDIIFTGTENSKPMNYCRVSITFDNEDGALPLDYKEVAVSRKVFRDGDSEYTINRNNCRLKDIRELFMDTGVGKEGYSIISQGRIDEILSSRPEERRLIFDEASGVAKLKYKKDEASKKLEKTLDNLTRIKDITNQLKDRHVFLEKESAKAKEGLKLINELELHQLSHYKKYLIDSESDLNKNRYKLEELNENRESLISELNIINKTYNPIKDKLKNLELELEQKSSELDELNKTSTFLKADSQVLREKLDLKGQELKRVKLDIENESITIEKTSSSIKEEQEVQRELNNKINEVEELLKSKNTLLQEIEKRIVEVKAKQSIKEEEIQKLRESLSELELSKNTNIGLSKNYLIDLDHLNSDLNNIIQNNVEIKHDYDEKKNQKEEKQELLNELKAEHEILLGEIMHNQKEHDALKTDEIELVSKIGRLKSNYEILNNMYQNYEGFNKSVQRLLKSSEKNPDVKSKILGTLAELISVEDKYSKAIEYALGQSIQNIVTETSSDAKYLIEYLKANNLGRVTFLPIERFTPRQRVLNGLTSSDYLAVASDAIKCDEKIKPIIEYQLNRTLIVKNIDDALRVQTKNNQNRIVTLDGDIINTWGSMVGGSIYKSTGSGLINRKNEIDQIAKNISMAEKELLEVQRLLQKLSRDLIDDKTKLTDYEQQISKYLSEIDALNAALAEINLMKDINQDRINKIEAEIEQKNLRQSELTSVSEDDINQLKSSICELENQNELIDNSKRKLYDDKMNMDVDILAYKNEIELIKRDVLISQNNISDLDSNLNFTNGSLQRNKKYMSDCTSEIENIEKKIEENEKNIESTELQINSNSIEIKKCRESISELKYEHDNMSEDRFTITTKISTLDLNISKIESQINSIHDRIQTRKENLVQEYMISEEELIRKIEELDPIKTSLSVIRELKSRIRDIGHFSYDSIEEFKIVSDELEFYINQKEDLLSSKADIEKIIETLDVRIVDTFNSSFSDINDKFNKIFSILFEGGRARLILNTDDILNAGVDIEVEPPGKKLQNLSLLSGGERALTAVALLFAIFETRPAPFCILDEVDAALDESNIARYVNYLRSFKDIQFIIITHRKLTMEIADILYGVTMEQEGISKMLTLELQNA